MTLVGTIIEAENSLAIIADPNGQFDVKGIGEILEVDPAGIAVANIEAEQVTLDYRGDTTVLVLERKQKKNKVKEDEHALVDPPLLDTSGKLPGGQPFENFRELKQILLTSQRRRIIENIVKRTLSYALARELNIHDMPTVDAISSELDRHGNLELREGSYHDLIHLVVNSLPFTHAQTSQIKTTD